MSDLYDVGNIETLDFRLNSPSRQQHKQEQGKPVKDALNVVLRQLEAIGRRPRTIESYQYIFNRFIDATGVAVVEDIKAETIYQYLAGYDVSLSTKKIHLKTIKAVLSRFYDNGWFAYRFWTNINVKVDKEVKEGASPDDVELLLALIDKTTFTGLRNAAAILLMYKTGIRISTVGRLKERHVNFGTLELALDGSIQKNRSSLRLPIPEQLAEILAVLIRENEKVREHYGEDNDYLFISFRGTSVINTKSSTNAISKALSKYARQYDLRNVNAHAIRRAFARNLLDKGASVPLISKALDHADLSTTTDYLHLSTKEISDSLRGFL